MKKKYTYRILFLFLFLVHDSHVYGSFEYLPNLANELLVMIFECVCSYSNYKKKKRHRFSGSSYHKYIVKNFHAWVICCKGMSRINNIKSKTPAISFCHMLRDCKNSYIQKNIIKNTFLSRHSSYHLLHYVASHGKIPILTWLLCQNINVDIPTYKIVTRNKLILPKGVSPLWFALFNHKFKAAGVLISSGAKINKHFEVEGNGTWCTLLYFAIKRSDKKVIDFLLEYNVDPNKPKCCRQYKDYYYPLQLAIRKRDFKLVSLLLNHGARLRGSKIFVFRTNREYFDDDEIFTSSYTADTKLDILTRLIERNNIAMLQHILTVAPKRRIHMKKYGLALLMCAIKKYNADIVRILLQHKVPINERDNSLHKETPLHRAVRLESYLITKLLLERGARTDIVDAYNKVPQEYIDTVRNREILKLFTHNKYNKQIGVHR